MEVALSRSVNDEKKPCDNLGEECSDGGKSLCKGAEAGQSEWTSGRRRGQKAGRGQTTEDLEALVRNLDPFQEARRASGKAMASSDLSLETRPLAAL